MKTTKPRRNKTKRNKTARHRDGLFFIANSSMLRSTNWERMSSKVHGVAAGGGTTVVVDVECHITNGLPNVIIVGFANKAVDESKERLRGAFSNSGVNLPRKRITINLAPADLPKESPGFDLAIAVAIMAASEQISPTSLSESIFIGELGLDGSVKPVRGIIGSLVGATRLGKTTFYVPLKNVAQAQLVPNITVLPVESLRQLYRHMSGVTPIKPVQTKKGLIDQRDRRADYQDFKHITGQVRAKRAMEIAAAGAHNILLNGPPGTGKSMLAKALPSILSPLEIDEILEITHLHSLATHQFDQIILDRPFRAPHHTASEVSIVGGGQKPKPGEISLSHRGVLFFDEFPEFNRSIIEALRQPLEDKLITVSRAKDTFIFPADFILVATCNPCPCGYYGTDRPCNCSPHEIAKYQRKLSGPILDRIDLYIDVDNVKHDSLLSNNAEESSKEIVKRVIAARERQSQRFKKAGRTNASLTNQEIKQTVQLSESARSMLNIAAERLRISPRAYMRLVKVSRTIADLAGSEQIESPHIGEALQYRRQDHFV